MMAGIGLLELAGGALIVLGIFAAFMVWAIFPLLPFLIAGAIYGAVRYGVPAVARGAVAVEHGAARAVRWALHPLATWALHEPAPVQSRRR
jgi:hypothetical protein